MKKIVIYDSKHGHTKRVAQKFGECYNVESLKSLSEIDLFIFLCPTYGDEELPPAMENFFQTFKIENKQYIICELGNYYGYDDFQFGAMKIIENHLKKLGWKKAFSGLSLDSLPTINWDVFYQWKKELDNALQKNFN